ncbi:MAG: L-histidine N(alpha)-methyltransferase [bacterium]
MELSTLENLSKSRLKVKISRRDKSVESFADDIVNGLTANPKTLPPKYFYDAEGSQLFEQICALPEYYVTRTESKILKKYADAIVDHTVRHQALIELGSGSSVKTRLLIEALLRRSSSLHYFPIDISESILIDSASALIRKYSNLRITAIVSEYYTALEAIKHKRLGNKLIVFLGSNIGNFELSEAERLLEKIREAMNEGDHLLLGIDLIKDRSILEPAYADRQGVTARFNLNILARINRELDGNFDLARFRHQAIFNESLSRVELHLRSTEQQTVLLKKLNRCFSFCRGETIHTENSYKFSMEQIETLSAKCGFSLEKWWCDANRWFSVNLLSPA